MALKTFVKISEVNNLSDARYCAGMGVNLIGFPLEKESEFFINAQKFAEITEWLSGVELVGEFQSAEPEEIGKAIEEYDLNYIQVSQLETAKALKFQTDLPVILKIDVDHVNSIEALENILSEGKEFVKFFLLESGSEMEYKKHLLDKVLAMGNDYPIVIGFNVTENNVHRFIDETPIYGIALKGGQEIRPGFKDFDELADILEAIDLDEMTEEEE